MLPLQQQLRRFVIDNFLYGQDDGQLSNDDSFIAKGIIDSTGVLELVSFLEKNFKIKVEDEELMPENLDSIHRLERYLTQKLQPSR